MVTTTKKKQKKRKQHAQMQARLLLITRINQKARRYNSARSRWTFEEKPAQQRKKTRLSRTRTKHNLRTSRYENIARFKSFVFSHEIHEPNQQTLRSRQRSNLT